MTRTEKTRSVLSDWRFWITSFGFGLGAVVVALYLAFGRIAHEEAFRAAAAKAANATQVGQCFTSEKNGPVTRGFIAAQGALIENSLLANQAAIKAQPNDPLTAVREHSLTRLRAAKKNANELRELIDKSIPTKTRCVRLARMLHVDASRYLK